MKRTRIALVQMESKFGAVKENLTRMEVYIKEAAARDVHIICFPELCVHSYNRERSHLFAEPVPGDSSIAIAELARKNGLTVLAGLAEIPETGNGPVQKPYITQVVAFPDGMLGKYRKTHLGRSELPYFTPGDELNVFVHDRARFAVQICWDLHFPEVTTILSLRGAEIIFAPHASPAVAGNRKEIWLKYLAARAYDNAVYVAACNLVGNDGEGQSFSGGAMVIDPRGDVVAEAFNGREEMIVVDLDGELLNTIRYQKSSSMRYSFFLLSRRPELYGELVKGGSCL